MTTESQPPREAAFFTAIRNWGIVRGRDGVLGGVVQGVGERIGMAPVPARIIVVVLGIVLHGIMLVAYAAAWALLPDQDGNIIIQNFGRGVTNVGALIGIGAFLLVGLSSLDGPRWIWGWTGTPWVGGVETAGAVRLIVIVLGLLFPLLVIGGVIWLIVYLVKRSDGPTVPSTKPGVSAPTAAKRGAAHTPPPPTTQAAFPPAPPMPRAPIPYVPGPGRGGYLGVFALIFIAIAVVWWTSRVGELAVTPLAAWFALWLVGLGLILVIVSATGRKQGFLGFISVPLVLLGIMGAFYGDNLRDAYHNARDIIANPPASVDEGEWQTEDYDSVVVDPISYFEDDYLTMVFTPECFAGEPWDVEGWGPVTRVRYGQLDDGVELAVVAPVTEVTVPAGTSLVFEAVGFAQSVVYWPERGIWCDFWDGDGTNAALLNPGASVLTLTVYDDAYANMIIINELETTS